MPAMPIALSRAPIVVGIRQTSRLTRVARSIAVPNQPPIGRRAPSTMS
jgi:hypothetical protein